MSAFLQIDGKTFTKAVKTKQQKPFTSEAFPLQSEHPGPRYEIRFFPCNFSKKGASLYVDVARENLQRNKVVDIPSMDLTVTLSRFGAGVDGQEERPTVIKSLSVKTKRMVIRGCSKSGRTVSVASFPQLVNHEEMGFAGTEREGLLVRVDIRLT